jgi:hypothetical protein
MCGETASQLPKFHGKLSYPLIYLRNLTQ